MNNIAVVSAITALAALTVSQGAQEAQPTPVEAICRDSLLRAVPSAMSRVRHPAGDKSLAYYGPGSSDHWSVQISLQVATALAILADEPEDALAGAGVTPDELSEGAPVESENGENVGYSAPGFLANGYGWNKWIFYATASLWASALDNARQFGEADLERRLVEAFKPYLGPKAWLLEPKFHVDYNVVGAVPLTIARLTGDEEARKVGLALAEFQWSEPTVETKIVADYATLDECRARWREGYSGETRLWIDDMYMMGLLQTEAYRLTGDVRYVRRIAKEMCLYLDELQLPDGLFNHAADLPIAWGRGAGWMAAAMPIVLSCMKPGDEHYDRILAGYRLMMDRLLACQRKDGLWGQIADDPESWGETSGSAMFAYGIAAGVEHGWLDGEKWLLAVRRAWTALCDRIDGFGNVSGVCVGTDKRNDRAYYLARPTANGDPHGQAPMLWLDGALARIDCRPR